MAGLTLTVPEDLYYRMNFDTNNGHISVEGISAREVRADTSNGRIVFSRLGAKY